MMKIIIADDEPLVQIGLRSMIDWNSLGIEICGTASNGDATYELIQKHRPDIVITDIQMPCSSGLQLGKKCRENLGRLPVFLILTSYEEFEYAKEALSFQAVDYLVKIDLSPESLTAAVQKAIEQVTLLKKQTPDTQSPETSLSLFQDRFYIRLLNNLFESREQFLCQKKEFQIELEYPGYTAANLSFFASGSTTEIDKVLSSYRQALQMFQELTSKFLPCHLIILDTQYVSAIFYIESEHMDEYRTYIRQTLSQTLEMLYNYYNISLFITIGRIVSDPLELSSSYYDSKQITKNLSNDAPILFWDEVPDTNILRNVFNFSIFRNDIIKAFDELDANTLRTIFSNITVLLSGENVQFSQALDAASNILHLSVTLIANGNEIVSDIFKKESDNYHSLYRQRNVASILKWLKELEDGLLLAFEDGRQNYQNALAARCCQYINEHIHERIYLQNIANALDISPNYLSQIFKKHMKLGITEYITNKKIDVSRTMLKETNLKIYEISDTLGFESSFYFSKVFKKITGISPKDYRNLK